MNRREAIKQIGGLSVSLLFIDEAAKLFENLWGESFLKPDIPNAYLHIHAPTGTKIVPLRNFTLVYSFQEYTNGDNYILAGFDVDLDLPTVPLSIVFTSAPVEMTFPHGVRKVKDGQYEVIGTPGLLLKESA